MKIYKAFHVKLFMCAPVSRSRIFFPKRHFIQYKNPEEPIEDHFYERNENARAVEIAQVTYLGLW